MTKIVSKAFSWTPEQRKEFFTTALKNLAPYLVVIIPVLIDRLPSDWAYASIVIFLLQRALSFFRLWVVEAKK